MVMVQQILQLSAFSLLAAFLCIHSSSLYLAFSFSSQSNSVCLCLRRVLKRTVSFYISSPIHICLAIHHWAHSVLMVFSVSYLKFRVSIMQLFPHTLRKHTAELETGTPQAAGCRIFTLHIISTLFTEFCRKLLYCTLSQWTRRMRRLVWLKLAYNQNATEPASAAAAHAACNSKHHKDDVDVDVPPGHLAITASLKHID